MKSFFFSTSRPFQWTSGPNYCTLDPDDGWASIASLERARELALERNTGYIGDNTVVASYGIIYDLEDNRCT